MGQQLADADVVHNRGVIGVVDGGLNLVLADFLADKARKLVVDGVAGTGGHDTALNGLAYQGHVADDVEQLVAGALVLPYQGLRLDVAQTGGVHVGNLQKVGQLVQTLLGGLTLVNHNGVLHVAALDKIGFQQGLYVAHENKGAGRGYLLGIVGRIVERGKLAVDELRLKGAHGGDAELLVGQNRNARTRLLVFHLKLVTDDIVVFWGVLLLDAYLIDLLHILYGTAVENGKLRTVHLYQTVVDTKGIKGRQTMLHRRDAHLAVAQNGAPLGVYHLLGHCVDNGLAVKVYALYLVTMVLGGRIESHGETQTGVKSLAEQGKASLECFLL